MRKRKIGEEERKARGKHLRSRFLFSMGLIILVLAMFSDTYTFPVTSMLEQEEKYEKHASKVESSDVHLSNVSLERQFPSAFYENWLPEKWNFEMAENWGNLVCADEDSAELIIGVQQNGYAELTNLIGRSNSELIDIVSMGGEIVALVVDVPLTEVSGLVTELRVTGLSRYIEPNIIYHVAFVSNDLYRTLQWGLRKVEAYSAWNITIGDPRILVAIVDTGVDYEHPDLRANYVALGHDWVNDDPDPTDDHGHGTHCAGIIASELNNSIGIAGVAQVRIMAEKALNKYGSGWSDDLANAIYHAVDQGANIISNSWGGYETSELIYDAIRYAYEAGVLVIASAGNDAWDLKTYPAAYEEVVAVTATDIHDEPTGFTNFGDWVELAAPGSLIFSTFSDSAYRYLSGTSMSTPYVAGVAALVWSQFLNMTRDQVRIQLRRTSDDLGDRGFDLYYGYGRINARKAVEENPAENDVLILGWQKRDATRYYEPEDLVAINTTIFNFGTNNQRDVTLHLLINGNIVDSERIDLLERSESATIRFSWTPHFEGMYNVTSYVLPVPGENITENNALSVNVRVRIPKVINVQKNDQIQDAINAAYPGDTVRVASGIYYEHLTINKSLSLIGGKGGTTIIDGNGTGTVVHVLADNVSVNKFTIQNGERGIFLYCSEENTITSNRILNNSEGLILFFSGSNTLTNNTMINNGYNFGLMGEFRKYLPSHFIQYVDASNTVDGKPVYYWVNQHNKQIPFNAGYVALISSTNITARDLDLNRNGQAVLFAYTNGSKVESINASQNKQGIVLVESFNNEIYGNTMTKNDQGIYLQGSHDNSISENTILNNIEGVHLRHSSNNLMSGNMICSNYYWLTSSHGVWLEYSTSNKLSNNLVMTSFEGISLACSGYNTLKNNSMIGNTYNFRVDGNYLSDFIVDIDISNIVDGKPVYYSINQYNLTISPSTFPNIGYLAIVNSTNITVKNLNLTNNRNGILLAYTSNCTVENVSASNNEDGIYLFHCGNSTIQGNTVIKNYRFGILLSFSTYNEIHDNLIASVGVWSSKNNLISRNRVSNKQGSGIQLEDSSRNNVIVENNVSDSRLGIELGLNEPHNNSIYNNNFVNNVDQVFSWIGLWLKLNMWDNGYCEGNYWGDYTGVDLNGDGIGDTNLPHENVDGYPLIKPWIRIAAVHELFVFLYAPYHLLPGDSCLLVTTVYNFGSSNETNVELDLQINGTIETTWFGSLESGDRYSLVYSWTPPFEATYNVTACAPPVPGEKMATNNIASVCVSVRFVPDLSVSLEAPSFLSAGNSSLLEAMVTNLGSKGGSNVELHLLIDGKIVNKTVLPELDVNCSGQISYLWTPAVPGTYNLTAYAPPVVEEEFILNNKATRSVHVELYERTTVHLSPLTSQATVAETFTVNINVFNVTDLSAYQFYLYYNNNVLEGISVNLPEGHFLTPEDPNRIYIVECRICQQAPRHSGVDVSGKGCAVVAVLLLPPELGKSGSGILITITFNATAPGESPLELHDVILLDSRAECLRCDAIDGSVDVTVTPDLNGDGIINVLDLVIFAKAFGSYPGHPRWNPRADIDENKIINILDGAKIAKNFGKTA